MQCKPSICSEVSCEPSGCAGSDRVFVARLSLSEEIKKKKHNNLPPVAAQPPLKNRRDNTAHLVKEVTFIDMQANNGMSCLTPRFIFSSL